MSTHRLPIMGSVLAANMTNESWLLSISSQPLIQGAVSAISTGTAPLGHCCIPPCWKPAFTAKWKKMIDFPALHLSQTCENGSVDHYGPGFVFFFPTIVFAPLQQEEQSPYSLCSKLDHLLAGTISHCDQCLHVKLLLTQDQEALLPWNQKTTTAVRAGLLQRKLNRFVRVIPWALYLKQSKFAQSKGLRVTWDECFTAVGIRWSVKHLQTEACLWRALCGERLIAAFLSNIHKREECKQVSHKKWGQQIIRPPIYFDVCGLWEGGGWQKK